MTNAAFRKLAAEKFEQYMGIRITNKMVTLLESSVSCGTGDYLFFTVGKCSYMWRSSIVEYFVAYPTSEAVDGMVVYSGMQSK